MEAETDYSSVFPHRVCVTLESATFASRPKWSDHTRTRQRFEKEETKKENTTKRQFDEGNSTAQHTPSQSHHRHHSAPSTCELEKHMVMHRKQSTLHKLTPPVQMDPIMFVAPPNPQDLPAQRGTSVILRLRLVLTTRHNSYHGVRGMFPRTLCCSDESKLGLANSSVSRQLDCDLTSWTSRMVNPSRSSRPASSHSSSPPPFTLCRHLRRSSDFLVTLSNCSCLSR